MKKLIYFNIIISTFLFANMVSAEDLIKPALASVSNAASSTAAIDGFGWLPWELIGFIVIILFIIFFFTFLTLGKKVDDYTGLIEPKETKKDKKTDEEISKEIDREIDDEVEGSV